MPGLRVRSDGWTTARTRVFLATLARTGCITDAARVAGVSTTSVNRSRALFAPFDAACREALGKALRGLEAVAYQRAVEGRETVIYRAGKEVERRVTPSDAILKLLIERRRADEGDAGAAAAAAAAGLAVEAGAAGARDDAATTITAEEHAAGWRFDASGVKIFYPGSASARLLQKLERIRANLLAEEAETGICTRCGQLCTGEAAEELARQRAREAEDADAETMPPG